tara:strand:- start:13066 stop:13794 length:729 start_codon:yes stop_codon:yes gene_type:complete
MKVLITGANGMLGSVLSTLYKNATLLGGKKDLDLTCSESIKSYFKDKEFDTIIHCAAYTNLNWCDYNPMDAYYLHSTVVSFLQKHCKKLIYISTNPTNSKRIYYQSKIIGEELTLTRPNDLVIRTNIYGNGGLVKWAVNSIIENKQIGGYSNVIFNPVSVYQLSDFIYNTSQNSVGSINVCSDTVISKYEFIKDVAKKLKLNLDLIRPSEIKGDLNLTIPKEKSILYNYQEGIDLLCKKLTL